MIIIDSHVHTLESGTMCSGSINAGFKKIHSGLKKRGIYKALFLPINDSSY